MRKAQFKRLDFESTATYRCGDHETILSFYDDDGHAAFIE